MEKLQFDESINESLKKAMKTYIWELHLRYKRVPKNVLNTAITLTEPC